MIDGAPAADDILQPLLAQDEPPKRIQRRRTKGWRMPPNAVYVGRGSFWGNPYKITERPPMLPASAPWGRKEAVEAYELMLAGGWRLHRPPGFQIVERCMIELEGKDLCCWCALDVPCHATALLKYANARVTPMGDVIV